MSDAAAFMVTDFAGPKVTQSYSNRMTNGPYIRPSGGPRTLWLGMQADLRKSGLLGDLRNEKKQARLGKNK